MSNPTPPTQTWEARFDKKFVKDHWENHNGVRFNERTLLYVSPTFDLEDELKSFIRQELKAEREANELIHNELFQAIGNNDKRFLREQGLLFEDGSERNGAIKLLIYLSNSLEESTL